MIALTNFDNQLSSAGLSLNIVPISALTSLGRSAAVGSEFDFSLRTGILTVGSNLGTENVNVVFSQQIFAPFP